MTFRSLRRVLASVSATLAELKTFLLLKVVPARARDGLLVRLERLGGPSVWLLGTIHGGHLETEAYSLAHLEAVLLHLHPARLLVESRPEEVAAGNLADGPFEMGYLSLTARAAGIPFDGVDWWDEDAVGLRRTNAEREDRIARNVVARLPAMGSVLVVVGFSHIPELVERLRQRGYMKSPVSSEERAMLFDTAGISQRFPAGMAAALERRIAVDEGRLREAPASPVAGRARGALAARRELLVRVQAAGERS
jgi:hypothetical protein